MRIIRFIDEHGVTCFGTDLVGGTATVMEGQGLFHLLPTTRRAEVTRLLAPLQPTAILCIGKNYADHAAETGSAAPQRPVLFMKNPWALNSPGAAIVIPPICQDPPQVDFECELAVVIGRSARDVSVDEALDYVFGYTIANDVSARWWQKNAGSQQWIRGKSFDGFCPLGPCIVTADEIPDPQALTLRTDLNGQRMQEGHTRDMIFPVAQLISQLSQGMTMGAGTVILTGTPAGVGMAREPAVYLQHGDQLELSIEPIGTLKNHVVQQ